MCLGKPLAWKPMPTSTRLLSSLPSCMVLRRGYSSRRLPNPNARTLPPKIPEGDHAWNQIAGRHHQQQGRRKGQWLHSIEATNCSVSEWRKTECELEVRQGTPKVAFRKRSKHQLKQQLFSWLTDHRSWDQMTSNRDDWQKTVRWAAKTFASFWGETTGKEGFIQGSYPLSETIFQDFFRIQIDFSRAPKCTIIEAINPYEIEIQK